MTQALVLLERHGLVFVAAGSTRAWKITAAGRLMLTPRRGPARERPVALLLAVLVLSVLAGRQDQAMAPATGTALLIIAVFVLPGFVALTIRERTWVVRGEDTPFERLLSALFYSALVYAIALGVASPLGFNKGDLVATYNGEKALGEDLAIAAILVLLLPLLLTGAGLYWRRSKLRRRVLGRLKVPVAHSTHSGWNEMFSSEGEAFIRVILTDGRVVGGFYGDGSMAGYSEQTQDLYIVQRWEMADGWFAAPVQGSTGVWLPQDTISTVELYEFSTEPVAANANAEPQQDELTFTLTVKAHKNESPNSTAARPKSFRDRLRRR